VQIGLSLEVKPELKNLQTEDIDTSSKKIVLNDDISTSSLGISTSRYRVFRNVSISIKQCHILSKGTMMLVKTQTSTALTINE
jgi:hypothetical protein